MTRMVEVIENNNTTLELILANNPRDQWRAKVRKEFNYQEYPVDGYTDLGENQYRFLLEELEPGYTFPYEVGDIIIDNYTGDKYMLISYPALDSRRTEFNPFWVLEVGNVYTAINISNISHVDNLLYISKDNQRFSLSNINDENMLVYSKLLKEGKSEEFYDNFMRNYNIEAFLTDYQVIF